jgi:vacuolar iron transporter family protein
MNHSLTVGVMFGVTSGVITTLGVIVGLNAGTHSQAVVIGGIVTIAIADALSDALGIHISEESENIHSPKEIWSATIATFISKALMTLSFLIPIIWLEMLEAILVSIAWGFVVLTILSVKLAANQKVPAWKVIVEHLGIAALVVIATNVVGEFVARLLEKG